MADQNFSDVQAQMQNQMQTQSNDSGLKEAAQEMSTATRNLNQTNVNQLQQSNALIQSLQQTQNQIQTLASSVQALTNQQRMNAIQQPGGVVPPPPMSAPPPPPQVPPGALAKFGGEAKSFAGFVGREAAGVAKNSVTQTFANGMNAAEMTRQRAAEFNAKMNPMMAVAQLGAVGGMQSASTPGAVNMPNQGFMHSAAASVGLLHNPVLQQQSTFGQYNNAQSRNFGENAQDLIQGSLTGMAGMFSAENAGSMAGASVGGSIGASIGALGGPLAPITVPIAAMYGAGIGAGVGGRMGEKLDIANPIKYGINQIERSNTFAQGASYRQNNFLRGGGGVNSPGEFDLSQRASIGAGVTKSALKDLTFSTEDVQDMQEMFSDKGLNLGVQDAQSYKKNFEKRMEDAKAIMKMFNTTLDEATDFMAEEFGSLGFDSGSTNLRTRMLAGAHMSGLSPMQMAKVAASGAQAAPGMGLMTQTGSQSAIAASQLAGISATMGGKDGRGVDTNLLSTVGGEDGLRQLLMKSQMQFLGGTGGTLMALNNGAFGTDVMGAIENAGSGLDSDRLISFQSGKHRELNKIGQSPEMIQAQQFAMYKGLAKNLESAGGTEEERMMLLAQGQGMSSAEAEALIKSGKALPETVRKQRRIATEDRANFERDLRAEQFGLQGRVERGFRGAMEYIGINDSFDLAADIGGSVGDKAQMEIRKVSDVLHGMSSTVSYTEEGTDRMRKMKGSEFLANDNLSKSEKNRRKRAADISRKAKDMFKTEGLWDFGSETGSRVRDIIEDADPTTKRGKRQIMQAVATVRSGDQANLYADPKNVGGTEVMEVVKQLDLGEDTEAEFAKAFDYQETADESRAPKTVQEIANSARMMFMGEERGALSREVSDEDMVHAVDSKEFKAFMQIMNRLYNKGRSVSNLSDPEYQDMKRMAAAEFKKIQDPKVKKAIKKILDSRGIDINDDGSLDLSEARSVDPHSSGLFQNSFEVGLRDIQGDIDQSRKKDALIKGLGKFGIGKDAVSESGQISDIDRVGTSLGNMAEMKPEEIRSMMKDGNQYEKLIAATAYKSKQDKSYVTNLSGERRAALAKAFAMTGADATEGTVTRGTELDKDMLGTKTLEGMDSINKSLESTAAILKSLE